MFRIVESLEHLSIEGIEVFKQIFDKPAFSYIKWFDDHVDIYIQNPEILLTPAVPETESEIIRDVVRSSMVEFEIQNPEILLTPAVPETESEIIRDVVRSSMVEF